MVYIYIYMMCSRCVAGSCFTIQSLVSDGFLFSEDVLLLPEPSILGVQVQRKAINRSLVSSAASM